MNISPISFAGTTNFQDIISRPQAYVTTKPAASTSIKEEGKSHKGLKIAAGVVAAAALIAGGLVLGVNKGIFTKETSNKLLNQINPHLQKAGTWIKNTYTAGKTKVSEILGAISKKLHNIGNKEVEKAAQGAAEKAAQG